MVINSKISLVMFRRKRKIPHRKPIRFYGVELKGGFRVKYLVVHLDSKLKWGKHVEYGTKKATTSIMICRSFAGKQWGCNPRILRWIYMVIVKPTITYRVIGWGNE